MELVIIDKNYLCELYLGLREIASLAKYQTFSECLQHARHCARQCGHNQNKDIIFLFKVRVLGALGWISQLSI